MNSTQAAMPDFRLGSFATDAIQRGVTPGPKYSKSGLFRQGDKLKRLPGRARSQARVLPLQFRPLDLVKRQPALTRQTVPS